MNELQLGELEAEYQKYEVWCRANGLVAEFGKEFFDWMNNAV